MFKQVKQNRIFQGVIDQIEESILTGDLQIGDKLPPERELTELFGISRGTLREALRVLEQKGLIDIKTGVAGGAIVRSVPPQKMSESLGLLIRSQKVSMHEIAEFREDVEGTVAYLAATKKERYNKELIESLLQKAEECVTEGVAAWDRFIDLDNRIHDEFSHVADNRLYAMILHTIHENINRYYDRLLPRKQEIMMRNLHDLKKIASAIEAGLADEAKKHTQHHIQQFYIYMKQGKELI